MRTHKALNTLVHIMHSRTGSWFVACVYIRAAKALFLEISGTASLCHITSWLNTFSNLLLWLCSKLLGRMSLHTHACGKRTPPQKTFVFIKRKSWALCGPTVGRYQQGQMTLESGKVSKYEVRTRGVIIPCFQVANTQLSMAPFVRSEMLHVNIHLWKPLFVKPLSQYLQQWRKCSLLYTPSVLSMRRTDMCWQQISPFLFLNLSQSP